MATKAVEYKAMRGPFDPTPPIHRERDSYLDQKSARRVALDLDKQPYLQPFCPALQGKPSECCLANGRKPLCACARWKIERQPESLSSMQNLTPRHVKTEESLRLGVVSGWYSTKVSGTFVSGPHDSEADCLRKIAELDPSPKKGAKDRPIA
jgi:hypothetical protein